jgi:hypothetical protein
LDRGRRSPSMAFHEVSDIAVQNYSAVILRGAPKRARSSG